MMTVLVTGSSGHLGEAMARYFVQKKIPYIGIDLKASRYTTHVGSITDKDKVMEWVAGVDYIVHTATLHKPHIVTHSKQDFLDANIRGTLNLLEAARIHKVKGFIFTSTTSTFGDSLRPKTGEAAVWITEHTIPAPKNIYGVTKTAAEDLCRLYFRNHKLPCLVLKTSRFFIEEDDNREIHQLFKDRNIKANEFLHRRVAVEDIVTAHLKAIEKVEILGFEKYIISASSPFRKEHLIQLNKNAAAVVKSLFPTYERIYNKRGWKMFPRIGRVYVNDKARKDLDWDPIYDFQYVLDALKEDREFISPLSLEIGIKGYHEEVFEDGPYPVREDMECH